MPSLFSFIFSSCRLPSYLLQGKRWICIACFWAETPILKATFPLWQSYQKSKHQNPPHLVRTIAYSSHADCTANPHSEMLSTSFSQENLSCLQNKDKSALRCSSSHRNAWGWSPRNLESSISPFNCHHSSSEQVDLQ